MKTAAIATGLLAAASSVSASLTFSWSKCINVPRCTNHNSPDTSLTPADLGSILYYPSTSLASVGTTSRYSYDGSNGYWYSHDIDGSYVSPQGYLQFSSNYNLVGLKSKDAALGTTYWTNYGVACCLPDNVGTNIDNVVAYKGY